MTNLYIDGCEDCTAHAGALKAYEEAKVATNDWEIVKIYINSTVRPFSFRAEEPGTDPLSPTLF